MNIKQIINRMSDAFKANTSRSVKDVSVQHADGQKGVPMLTERALQLLDTLVNGKMILVDSRVPLRVPVPHYSLLSLETLKRTNDSHLLDLIAARDELRDHDLIDRFPLANTHTRALALKKLSSIGQHKLKELIESREVPYSGIALVTNKATLVLDFYRTKNNPNKEVPQVISFHSATTEAIHERRQRVRDQGPILPEETVDTLNTVPRQP